MTKENMNHRNLRSFLLCTNFSLVSEKSFSVIHFSKKIDYVLFIFFSAAPTRPQTIPSSVDNNEYNVLSKADTFPGVKRK